MDKCPWTALHLIQRLIACGCLVEIPARWTSSRGDRQRSPDSRLAHLAGAGAGRYARAGILWGEPWRWRRVHRQPAAVPRCVQSPSQTHHVDLLRAVDEGAVLRPLRAVFGSTTELRYYWRPWQSLRPLCLHSLDAAPSTGMRSCKRSLRRSFVISQTLQAARSESWSVDAVLQVRRLQAFGRESAAGSRLPHVQEWLPHSGHDGQNGR